MYQLLTLANGLRVLLIPHADTKAVTVEAVCPVGSRYETKKINGISHFIEHLMFKGTRRRPTTEHLTRELDTYGAEYNAYTSKDMTAYHIKIDAEKVAAAVDILADMLFHSKFESAEIERERGVVIEEIHMYLDNPTMLIEDVFEETLYGDHPLGWRIAGHKTNIETVTREEIMTFRDAFYEPHNMLIAVAGQITNDALKTIEQTFGTETRRSARTTPKAKKWKGLGRERVHVSYKETDQVQFTLGVPSYPFDHRSLPALRLVSNILGGTMSSRLFIQVRERRGLAYRVSSNVELYHDAGNWAVRAGVDKNRVEKALIVIQGELKKLKKSGVTAKELAQAKQNLRGRMILNLEDSSALAEFYVKQAALTAHVKTADEVFDEFERVTVAEANRVARTLLDWKKMRMAVVGPYKEAKRFVKLLG